MKMFSAIRKRDFDAVKSYLGQNDDALLLLAIEYKDIFMISTLIEYGVNIKDITMIAIMRGNLEIVELVLQKGANVNLERGAPLLDAIQTNNIELLSLLLKYGADVNIGFGAPLCLAIERKNISIINLLASVGADLNIYNGRPIIRAILNGDLETIKTLLDLGVDISNGTQLIVAVKRYFFRKSYFIDVIELLLKYGINVHSLNEQALTIATSYADRQLSDLLIKYGANPFAVHLKNSYYLSTDLLQEYKSKYSTLQGKAIYSLRQRITDKNVRKRIRELPIHLYMEFQMVQEDMKEICQKDEKELFIQEIEEYTGLDFTNKSQRMRMCLNDCIIF